MCKKYIEKNLSDKVKVVVKHFTTNPKYSRSMRKGHPYRTVCQLIDKETNLVVGFGEALCSRHEPPNRKLGRAVAVGRAMKDADLKNISL